MNDNQFLPAPHPEHVDEPAVETLPVSHSVHTVDASAPSKTLDFPAAQSTHAVLKPDVVRYVPARQSLHACAPVLGEYLPAAHGGHANPVVPDVPAGHASHVPLCIIWPMSHVHVSNPVDAAGL